MIRRHASRAEPNPPCMRLHDANGVSTESHDVIDLHGLDVRKVLGWANHYVETRGSDFNRAPLEDFKDAPLGKPLAKMAEAMPAFGEFREEFRNALDSFKYGTSDGIMDKLLRRGLLADPAGGNLYGQWKPCAERLEGLNAALFRMARDTTSLRRFVLDLGELDNYRRGRWRRDGDIQDRVSTTVGTSNFLLGEVAVAVASYDTSALRGWAQPVRYSPYPRKLDASRERFGHEKDGYHAGEGEVHIHAGCPIPPRAYIKISVLPRRRHGMQDVVERYGVTAAAEWRSSA